MNNYIIIINTDWIQKILSEIVIWIGLDWIFKDKYYPQTESSCMAALNGDLENLKWLKSNGYKFEPNTLNCAAINGNLEILKWLKANGCDFDELTMSITVCIVLKDHNLIENIKWLNSNGCVWGEIYWNYSEDLKFDKVICDYLKNLGCPWKEIN